ncbi:MAG: GPW/gp25 family protein [Thermomicrobiales bacterium]
MKSNGHIEQDIIGQGWAFPVRPDVRGRLAMTTTTTETIERAIRLILQTVKGERVMRPEFGSDLHLLTFASNDATTVGQADYYVRQALARWEPRVTVEKVSVSWSGMQRGLMLIEIEYLVKATNDRRNLVYPFYAIPEEV